MFGFNGGHEDIDTGGHAFLQKSKDADYAKENKYWSGLSSYQGQRQRDARQYLYQVTNCRYRIELLEKRKDYHIKAELETGKIQSELDEENEKLMSLQAEISDEISKLGNVKQEMVMTRRYVDGMDWEEIAEDMGITLHGVHKHHGKGLHAIQDILVADGKIADDEGTEDGQEFFND